MTDPKNPYAPPSAEVRDVIESKKLGFGGIASLVVLFVGWIWLLVFSPAIFELTNNGATSVLFMLGAYLGLVLIPVGAVFLLRRSRKAHVVLGTATVFLLLIAVKNPFLPILAAGLSAALATFFAFQASKLPHRPLNEA